MSNKIVFSLDEKIVKDPTLIGLKSADLENQEQVKIFSDGNELRDYVKQSSDNLEVWVLSSNNIESINLAATIKRDKPSTIVGLVVFSFSGSLKSRADAAKIDTVLSVEAFKERFYSAQITNKVKIPKSTPVINSKKGFLIPIFSSSGGAGKSSVAVVTALLSQLSGHRTLLLDGDIQFGDCADFLGAKKPITLEEIIDNKGLVSQLKPENNMPSVLASLSKPELAEKVIAEFPALISMLRQSFDVIVVNTSCYWSEQQAVLLEQDSKSIFLIDQRPTSLKASKKTLEMCDRCGIATGSILFAINRVAKGSLFSSIDVSCALGGVNSVEISDGGPEVDECMADGNPMELFKSRNPFVISLWGILENVLPKTSNNNSNNLIQETKNAKHLFRFGKKRA